MVRLPCIQRHIEEFDRREEPERDLWYESWGSRGGANCDPSDTFARCFPACFLAPRTIRIFEYAPWCTGKTSQASVRVMCVVFVMCGVCHVCVCVCTQLVCVQCCVCVGEGVHVWIQYLYSRRRNISSIPTWKAPALFIPLHTLAA